MTTSRVIRKNLAGEEDIAYGEGSVTQARNGNNYEITKVRTIRPVNSIAELNALDPAEFLKAALFEAGVVTIYAYNSGTGLWEIQDLDTTAITHTEGATVYNLATYLQNRHVATVAELVALSPVEGAKCKTVAYHDGWAAFKEPKGGADYVAATIASVRTAKGLATWVPDEYIDLTAANGLVWMFCKNGVPNLHQAGAKGDGVLETGPIKAAFRAWLRFHVNAGTYLTDEPLVFGDGNVRHITGDGWYSVTLQNATTDVIEMGRTITGTHTGTNDSATLIDSGATWEVNEFSDTTIANSTDGSTASVTSNTATTLTATLSGGSGNDWDTGDTYVIGNDASASIIEGITIKSLTGGGHVFTVKNAVSFFTLRNFRLVQENPTKSLWNQTSGYCGGNVIEQGHLVAASSGTMTVNPWFVQSNEITNGFVFRDLRCDYSRNGLQFFHIDSTAASSYTSQGKFDNITFELTYGGDIWLGGCKGVEINNCGAYDLASEQTGHGIYIGPSASSPTLASSRCKISRRVKHPTGGYTMAAGIQDIYLAGGKANNTILESCFNNTTAFKVDFQNNKALVIDRPGSTDGVYLNDAGVTYIDINGDYEGIVVPAVHTTALISSRELTIAAGVILPTHLYHTVDTEADAASDDLVTITTTNLKAGDILTLKAENDARTVVIKHGTGNIYLEAAVDYSLDTDKKAIQFLYTGSALIQVA
jgi:hypothetical protein